MASVVARWTSQRLSPQPSLCVHDGRGSSGIREVGLDLPVRREPKLVGRHGDVPGGASSLVSCELAMAQSILHQDDPEYPDTGLDPTYPTYQHRDGRIEQCLPVKWFEAGRRVVKILEAAPTGSEWWEVKWWQWPMEAFANQVRHHCHRCGIPLKGYGELAQSTDPNSREQVSAEHAGAYKPKRVGRRVELVTTTEQLDAARD